MKRSTQMDRLSKNKYHMLTAQIQNSLDTCALMTLLLLKKMSIYAQLTTNTQFIHFRYYFVMILRFQIALLEKKCWKYYLLQGIKW